MTEQEVKDLMDKAREEKLSPMVREMTALLVKAYSVGIEVGMEIGEKLKKKINELIKELKEK